MPYRRMPNSDATRLDALRAVYTKADATPAESLAFSQENYDQLKVLYPQFKKEMDERGTALSVQSESTILRSAAEEKCRLIVSHFLQVFNFGVARGIYKVSERAYFQLDINQENLPDLKTEEGLRSFAENIITGDPKRVAAGGVEMANPSAAEVEAAYNDYVAKLTDQSTKKDTYEKEQKDVDNMRAQIDELIRDIWDEIEFKFRKDEPPALRRKAREYGVVYVSRPGEPEEDVSAQEPQSMEQK